MRILFITNHLKGTDGWSRYSLMLIEELKKRGCDVKVVVKEKTLNGILQFDYLRDYYNYLLNPIQSFISALKINSLIKNWEPDIVHFLVEPYLNIAPFISKKKKTKFFLTIHGTFSYPPVLFKNFFKKLLSYLLFHLSIKRVDSVIAVSNFTKNYFIKYTNYREPLFVITNGVNIFSRTKYQKHVPPQILFVGAIKERKGIREGINALKYYKNNYSRDFVYIIIGDFKINDSYYKELLNLIKDSDLTENVFFKGRVGEEDLNKYYEESSLFLLLPKNERNNFEGFGLVYLEANMHGVPVLGVKSGGAPEAILNGKSGFVADTSNPIEVAHYIDLILRGNAIKSFDCIKWAEDNRIEKKIDIIFSMYKNI